MGKKVLLLILVIFLVLTMPFTARLIYIKLDQKNVHIIRARNFLPREDIEIRVKEYLKYDYKAFCFLPAYFTFDPDDMKYLRNKMNFAGSVPSSFSTDENQWAVLLIRSTTESDIIKFSAGINYPNTQIIAAINRNSDRSLVCSELKRNEDLAIKLQKIENKYRPISVAVGLK